MAFTKLSFLTNSTALIILFSSLVLINVILGYLYLFPKQVIINNNSSSYRLIYTPPNAEFNLLLKPRVKNVGPTISTVKINVHDGDIPDVVIPNWNARYPQAVNVTTSLGKKNSHTIFVNLTVNPVSAAKMSNHDLQYNLLFSISQAIYLRVNSRDINSTSSDDISNIVTQIYKSNPKLFELHKK